MDKISNIDVFYDIIDSLTDEEFELFLDKLSLKKEDEDEVVEKEEVVADEDEVSEKLAIAKLKAKRDNTTKEIKEKLERARLAKKNDVNEELRRKIKEKLELANKKRKIQEKIKNLKK